MTIENRLHEFITAQLAWEDAPVELTADTPLVKQGILDSLRLMELAAFLQAEYAFEVDDMDLTVDNFESIVAIANYVRRKTTVASVHEAGGMPGAEAGPPRGEAGLAEERGLPEKRSGDPHPNRPGTKGQHSRTEGRTT